MHWGRAAGQGGQSDTRHSFSSVVALRGASKDRRRELLVTLCVVALLSKWGGLAGSFPLVGMLPVWTGCWWRGRWGCPALGRGRSL